MTPSYVLLAFIACIWTLPMTMVAVFWTEKITRLAGGRPFQRDGSVEKRVGAVPVHVGLSVPTHASEEVTSGYTEGTPEAEPSYWGRQAGTSFYIAPAPSAQAPVTVLGSNGPEQRRARVFLN